MPFDARGLADQARSIADLQNTKNITNADENNFLGEAWRELHARYVNSGGDFFTNEYDFTLQALWKDPNVPAGTDWLVPLPADFTKIRYLDWFTGGTWRPVDVFSISQRDWAGGAPRYRLKNGLLWLIVPPGVGTQFRLVYYTPPAAVSVPDVPLGYGANIAPYNKALCSSPTWSPSGETMVYVYNGTQIIAESTDNATITPLYTAGGSVAWLTWYKGYLYWVQGGNIYRAPTDFVTSPLVPVAVINTGTVINLSVWGNALYWSDGTNTRKANLDGTGGSIVLGAASVGYFNTVALGPVYLAASPGNVVTVAGAVVLASGIVALTSDGTYLYTLDGAGNVNRLVLVSPAAVLETDPLAVNMSALGPASLGSSRVPVISLIDSSMQAISTAMNTLFSFPTNEVSEIIAYLAAFAFARKSGDQPRMSAIQERLANPDDGLWARFAKVLPRDEYQAQRVNDGYGADSAWPWGL